jgi:hypothetical protein
MHHPLVNQSRGIISTPIYIYYDHTMNMRIDIFSNISLVFFAAHQRSLVMTKDDTFDTNVTFQKSLTYPGACFPSHIVTYLQACMKNAEIE